MKRKLTPLVLLAVILVLQVGTSTALLPDFTKEELIQQSQSIILGTVQELRCAWSEDHTQIFTYATLKIQDQFKGQAVGETLTIQIPGGTVGDMTQWVSDTPKLETGMKVILHTFKQDTGYNWIYGWEKGVLAVQDEAIPAYNMTIEQFRRLVEVNAK